MTKSSQRAKVPEKMAEQWATVNGCKMRYLHGGSGPPLLLIHGLMGYSFSWSENLTFLAEHFTIYAPDLLNCGYSDRTETVGCLESIARSVISFMDEVGLRRTYLLGTSHGGAVALAMAVLSTERFMGLVLVSPTTPWSETSRWQATVFSTWWGRGLGYLALLAPPFIFRYFVERLYADPSRLLKGTVSGYQTPLRSKESVRYLLEVMRHWFADFRRLGTELGKIQGVPMICFWGDKDVVVPMKKSEGFFRKVFPQARMLVVEDTGHLLYEERPEEFNRVLIESLRELG